MVTWIEELPAFQAWAREVPVTEYESGSRVYGGVDGFGVHINGTGSFLSLHVHPPDQDDADGGAKAARWLHDVVMAGRVDESVESDPGSGDVVWGEGW